MRSVDHGVGGGVEVLCLVDRPLPQPGAGEVRIRVAYAGVNRPDVLQRMGAYPPPPGASPVLGLEVSGRVDAIGAGVSRWQVGDAVCALVPGGGYAEFCVAPATHCLPLPPGVSLRDAAALPETYFTVWANVFELGRLQAGERLLVHGGSSGIGVAAIQLAVAMGAHVATTVGSDAKRAACEAWGADPVVNYREADFVTVIRDALGGVDVILDMVGGDYTPRNLALLAPRGRLVQIAMLRGARTEIDLMPIMTKRLTLTGSTLRPRSVDEKGTLAAALEAKVWPLFGDGRLRAIIDDVFPLDEVAAAHARMEQSAHVGKLLLAVDAEAG